MIFDRLRKTVKGSLVEVHGDGEISAIDAFLLRVYHHWCKMSGQHDTYTDNKGNGYDVGKERPIARRYKSPRS